MLGSSPPPPPRRAQGSSSANGGRSGHADDGSGNDDFGDLPPPLPPPLTDAGDLGLVQLAPPRAATSRGPTPRRSTSGEFDEQKPVLNDSKTDLADMSLDSDLFNVEGTAHPESDVARLVRIWMNERMAPEILTYAGREVENLLEMIESQLAIIENKRGLNEDTRFTSMLYEAEVERVRFVIKSYVRTRLSKIEKHSSFILADPMMQERLSNQELIYAEGYNQLVESHYHKTCLDALPTILRRLDEQHGNISMVSRPDLDSAVFCRVKRDIGEYIVAENNALLMQKGDIYMLRYKAVQQLLAEEAVELI